MVMVITVSEVTFKKSCARFLLGADPVDEPFVQKPIIRLS